MTTQEAMTEKHIITKQIVINHVGKFCSHLLPVTADEKVIDKIQLTLDNYEKLITLYERLNFINSTLYCNKQMTFDEREKLCKQATELSQQIEKYKEK